MTNFFNIKKKSILMLAPTPFFSDRGCHIQIADTYIKLSKNNKVVLVTYGLGRDFFNIPTKRVFNFPWYKKTSPGFSFSKILFDFFILIESLKFMFIEKIDYVYCHLHEGALIGFILKKIFKVKIIFDSQGVLSEELKYELPFIFKNRFFMNILDFIEKFVVCNSDIIFVSTEELQKKYKSIKKDSLVFFKPAFDIDFWNQYFKKINYMEIITDTDENIINNLLDKKKINIAYLGGLQRGKGIIELIPYLRKVKDIYRFFVFGFPVSNFKNEVKKYGLLNSKIFVLGRLNFEKSIWYLKKFDFLIAPKANFGHQANSKLYIYKLTGKPIICVDNKFNRSILGMSGIFVKKNNWVRFFNVILPKYFERKFPV